MGANIQHWATAFDVESVFVMDEPTVNEPTESADRQQVRYRVLRADGTEVQLQLLDNPAPAIPGSKVFVVDYGSDASGDGAEDVYLVDVRGGTLQPLAVPHLTDDPASIDARHWGPNVDEFLWFADRNCTVQWATEDGTFERSEPECAAGWEPPTYIHDDMFPDGWLQPGRLALLERNDGRLFLHVSLDYGSTWQRIPVSDEDAIPDALRQLG
jgi:hypothetical protein